MSPLIRHIYKRFAKGYVIETIHMALWAEFSDFIKKYGTWDPIDTQTNAVWLVNRPIGK